MISGRTELLAILGDPIAQATTPALVSDALARHAIDAVLVPMQVRRQDLQQVVAGLRRVGNFRGAVVTMPHKRAILPLLDTVGPAATAVQACNVVRREPDGSLVGDMLDGEAMVAALAEAGYPVVGRSVELFGAGGAAAGIAFSLLGHGVDRLALSNRTSGRANELADLLRAAHPSAGIDVIEDLPGQRPSSGRTDIVINATSLGMRADDPLPFEVGDLAPATVVADVVNRRQTALLAAAAARGCHCVDGTRMLSAQVELMIEHMLGPRLA